MPLEDKNGIQDLKKIMWYCSHLIEYLEKKEIKETLESRIKKIDEFDITPEEETYNE